MKILNIGSCNIDYFYDVSHIVAPGETLGATDLSLSSGGKGLNQSIALAKAGAPVYHGGLIGADGIRLKETLTQVGVNTDAIEMVPGQSGHAIIQRAADGENSILLFKGANHCLTSELIEKMLAPFSKGDILLLQNEMNLLDDVMIQAAAKQMQIAINPAPLDERVTSYPLDKVTYLIVNEVEGEQLSGQSVPRAICETLTQTYPNTHIILTLGSKGVNYQFGDTFNEYEALKVNAVDTTAAGDTFIGYFLSAIAKGNTMDEAIQLGIKASAITVTKKGSSESIPTLNEVI